MKLKCFPTFYDSNFQAHVQFSILRIGVFFRWYQQCSKWTYKVLEICFNETKDLHQNFNIRSKYTEPLNVETHMFWSVCKQCRNWIEWYPKITYDLSKAILKRTRGSGENKLTSSKKIGFQLLTKPNISVIENLKLPICWLWKMSAGKLLPPHFPHEYSPGFTFSELYTRQNLWQVLMIIHLFSAGNPIGTWYLFVKSHTNLYTWPIIIFSKPSTMYKVYPSDVGFFFSLTYVDVELREIECLLL